jgi:release factor glutamine methyltransferase
MQNQDEQWLLGEKYDGELCPAYYDDLAQLRTGVPVAYLIGWVPFLGSKIWLDSRPLIPRPETEWWVEKVIEVMGAPTETTGRGVLASLPQPHISERGPGRASTPLLVGFDHKITVLDLCAGSGCIGVAVAKHIPQAHVTFAELDPAHLPTIEKNAHENLSVNRKVFVSDFPVMQSDVFDKITGRFDFILTNPPYIDPALDRAEPSVKNHEPHEALYGGQGGMDIITRIITEAPDHLAPSGQLWMEHEPEQAGEIATLGATHGFAVSTHPDQYGVMRYSILVLQ